MKAWRDSTPGCFWSNVTCVIWVATWTSDRQLGHFHGTCQGSHLSGHFGWSPSLWGSNACLVLPANVSPLVFMELQELRSLERPSLEPFGPINAHDLQSCVACAPWCSLELESCPRFIIWNRFGQIRRFLAYWSEDEFRIIRLLDCAASGSPGHGPVRLLASSASEFGFSRDSEQEGWIRVGLPLLRTTACPTQHFRRATFGACQATVASSLCNR